MYKHLLVASDGSKLSLKAVKTAARLAKQLGARLTAVHVIAPYVPPVYSEPIGYIPITFNPKEYKQASEREAKRVLGAAIEAASKEDVDCGQVVVTDAVAWQGILKAARSRKCDALVMASHGRRGLAGLLLGSETTKVLTHTKLPVLVCR